MATPETVNSKEIIGNYNLLAKIADGSMGTVYKARHWQTDQVVALKVLSKEIARNPVLLKRFEQEFRITGKLDHPNIVKMIDYCGSGEAPYIAMEFVDGESLGEKLDREGRMSEEEALRIIVQVAHGLHHAHRQGLIHRDVKPDNILLSRTGEAKLTDLGLAKDIDASIDLTRTGRGLGTPNYMAPEQFRNAKNASISCDVYSLGATLYEMVTGEMPFGVTDPVQVMMRKLKNELPAPRNIVPTLSERVDWAIRRALSADPRQRPSTCREFVEDLTGQSTRLGDNIDDEARTDDVWYVVYTDGDDTVKTMQGSTQEVRAALREEKLGQSDMVRASRSKTGPFDPLLLFLEFRDLVVQPGEGPPLSEASSANLAKLGRLIQAAQESPPHPPSSKWSRSGGEIPAPARDGAVPAPPADVPHYRLPDSPASASSDDRAPEGLKLAVMFLLGIITSFLAFKYLLPLLNP